MADSIVVTLRLKDGRKFQAEMVQASGSIGTFEKKAESASRRLRKVGRGMRSFGGDMTRHLTLPVIAAGVVAGKMALDFDDSLTKVETLVGISQKQVGRWKLQIEDLAKTTAKSPKELADALYFITSSGIAVNKTMETLTVTAKASALGLGDSATIAQVLTSALNAYAKSGLTAKRATDILIAGTKAGKLEASELAESLGMVLPVASKLGVPLEQVVASMEAMSLTGTDAATAATQTSAFFSALTKVTPQAQKELGKYNLTAAGLRKDLANPRIGLLGVIKELDRTFGGNIEAMARVFPNIRALRAEFGLTGDQAKNVARVFYATTRSSGSLGQAWAKLSRKDAQKMRKGIVAIQVAAIKLGEKLLPIAGQIADKIAALADWFDKLSPRWKKVIGIALLFVVVLGPVVGFIGSLILAIQGVSIALAFLAANPVVLIIAALVALGIGLVVLYKKSETFRRIVNGAFNAVKTVAQSVFGWIKDHWKLLLGILLGPFGLAAVLIASKWKPIFEPLKAIIQGAIKLIQRFLRWLQDMRDKLAGGPSRKTTEPYLPGAGDRPLPPGSVNAEGGTMRPGDWGIAGEAGAELLRNVGGTLSITPLGGDKGSLGLTAKAPVIIKLDRRTLAEALAEFSLDTLAAT